MTYNNPFFELDILSNEINRMFNSAYKVNNNNRMANALASRNHACNYPKINIYNHDDKLYVEAAAPGIDPAKIEVVLTDNVLSISGEKEANQLENNEKVHRTERSKGKFVRTIELPSDVDAQKVEAHYKNGILLISLSKVEKTKPKSIEVKVS
jgi:HSP20 family protein